MALIPLDRRVRLLSKYRLWNLRTPCLHKGGPSIGVPFFAFGS